MNIDRQWFSAAELAGLGLPGLPRTKMGVLNLAKRERWEEQASESGPLSRRRAGRGGGTEYHIAVLPELAKVKLLAVGEAPATQAPGRESAWARFDRLPAQLKVEARRRLEIIQRVEALERAGLRRTRAIETVAEQAVREARLAGTAESCSTQTLYNWFRLIAGVAPADRMAFLAPDYVGRTETAECHPEAWKIFRDDYLRPKRSFASAYRLAADEAEKHGWALPSCKTLQRRLMKDVSRLVIVLMKEGEDALRRELPWIERDETTFHALEAVNVDGHKWDVMVDFGDGVPVRPMMVAIQDVYSRKILGWRIARTENANSVRMAFADVFGRFGIPRLCFFDNGRAFASKWLTGGTPTRFRFTVKEEDQVGLLTQFGVEVHFTTPYSGQSKPIERAFRDLEGEIGTSAAFQGAYVGNNPLDKPHDAGTRTIPLEEFERVIAEGIARHNRRKKRTTKACRGQLSFDEVFSESYANALIAVATPEQLRQSMLCVEGVTVRQNGGGLQLAGNRYWGDFLAELVGQKVAARFDPDDLHADVHVYSLSGVYLGSAECLEKVGFANAEEGRERQRLKRRLLRATKERAKAERELEAHELAALGPEFPEEEVARPAVLRPFFGGGAAPKLEIEDDEEALAAAERAFNRATRELRLVGEDE